MRVDTYYVALVTYVWYVQRPQREIPHLRKCPYKEGVETAQNQMQLHVVGCSLPSKGRLMAPNITSARGHELSGRVCAQAYNYYAWGNALGLQSKLLITPLSE